MDKQTKILVLPDRVSIETVPPFFEQIKHLHPQTPIEIDFEKTKSFDSAGIAFVNHLRDTYPNLIIKNIKPEYDTIFEMFPSLQGKSPHKKKQSGKKRLSSVALSLDNQIRRVISNFSSGREMIKAFLMLLADELYYTFQYILKRRGVYPGEVWNQLYFMAYKSYPIVSLISFLVGVTISLTSAEQLRNFGADIYLADLVGFGMVRELVPLMTGIILAGKIGASITAEVASMKVLEETDALKTMGIVPEKFLMVPRLLAISIAIPLLVAIADFIGIVGGFLVGKFFSGIPAIVFYNEMMGVVGWDDFLIGIVKTLVFGWIVVISAGFKGFTVERSPTGVGISTTESVVLSISLIIIFDCIFALLLY